VYAGLFPFLLYLYGDADWGWHLRYGEYLVTHGRVLRRDIFSWTMEGYAWTNHSWLYDLLLYAIYTRVSFLGLSLAGALVGLGAFVIGIWPFRLSYWHKAVLAAVFATLASGALVQGLRSQVVGLLLLSILMLLLFHIRDGKAWSHVALPALFALWANVHGSFALGIAIVFIFLAGESLPLTRAAMGGRPGAPARALVSFLACLAATLVNPFGAGVYLEALAHFQSPLHGYVVEWKPEALSSPRGIVLAVYTLGLAAGFAMRRKRSDAPCAATALALLYLALGSRRYIPVYMVGTLPFAAMIIKEVSLPRARYRIAALGAVGLIALALEIGLLHRFADREKLLQYTMASYCEYGPRCSEGLTRYLLDHPPRGRGFNVYDWGGQLIGRGVEAKLFIDGRMHVWERDGYRPIVEYARMYGMGVDLRKFDDYRFDWAIVQRGHRLDRVLERSTGWDRRYRDGIASYYVRRE
jgi:hypothetical protein